MTDHQNEEYTVRGFLTHVVANLEKGQQLLAELDPKAMETAEACNSLLLHIERKFGEIALKASDYREFAQWAEEHNMSQKEAAVLLAQGELIGSAQDDTSQAQNEIDLAQSQALRCMLFLRVRRDYLRGLSDIIIGRTNSGIGSLRVQAETLAILKLMAEQPRMWKDYIDWNHGADQRFYNKYHRRIRAQVKDWQLDDVHDMASSSAMHSRIDGIISGLIGGGGITVTDGALEFSMTNLDTVDPGEFFLMFCYYLRFFQRVIGGIPDIVPQLAGDEDLKAEYQSFKVAVDERYAVLLSRYPQYAKTRSATELAAASARAASW